MNDVERLRRAGDGPFPAFRKSPDPYMPEMGEMDFSQDMNQYDNLKTTTVSETQKIQLNPIADNPITDTITITTTEKKKKGKKKERKPKDTQPRTTDIGKKINNTLDKGIYIDILV